MQRLRILVILILLSLMPLYSLAVLNEGQYAFRSLDINNGLSQNTVHAILQDKQGFMWFGTKDGLDRYDGISFRTFMKESGTLGNNFITSLYEDNLGQIWIGTDVGLYVYCPQMEKVRHFTLISNSNIDIDCTVNLITGDQKGGYLGYNTERHTTAHRLHRHRPRPEAGEPASTYAGILARRASLGKRIYDGSGTSCA